MPAVMSAIAGGMEMGEPQVEKLKEAEAACRCAESWVGYGIRAE